MADQNQPAAATNPSNVAKEPPARSASMGDQNVAAGVVFVVFVASVIELIAAGRLCDERDDRNQDCEKEYLWAVIAGVVSAFFCLVFLIAIRFFGAPASIVLQVGSLFLFAWWCAGAGVLTFRDPFTLTGNGYFASWLAFMASAYLCYTQIPLFHDIVNRLKVGATQGTQFVVFLVFLASIIETTAAATLCDKRDECEDEVAWGVAVGAVSTAFTFILLMLSQVLTQFTMPVAVLLATMWVFGVGVLTFDEPWTITGNGYFSTWLAFFASMYWAFMEVTHAFPQLKPTK